MFDDHKRHIFERQSYLREFENDKREALEKARALIKTALSFDEIGSLIIHYYSTDVLIEFYEEYKEVNVYYNSGLAKAMREEE